MSTKESLELNEITSGNPLLSSIRSIVETTFYGNNVHEVFDRKTAYQLAKGSPGTIITDLTISHAEELDLPADVRTLVFNDGSIVGRQGTKQIRENFKRSCVSKSQAPVLPYKSNRWPI